MKDSLNPTLKSIKKDLLSNKINKPIFSNTKSTIIKKANEETPIKTGDLLESIVLSPSIFSRNSDFVTMHFGARGGDDPKYHTDPGNYAWEVAAQDISKDLGYFGKIFHAAELMFINSFEREVKEVLLNNVKNSYGR